MQNNNVKSILNEVLEEIHPDKSYEKDIFEKIDTIIKKINHGQKSIKAILGGSGAKGTWLKTFDADIFVLFDYKKFKDKSGQLSDILEKILKKKFRQIARLHGSRDYFQIKQGNFTFEIVPLLKIKKAEQAKNITDVSPLHSNWVKKHKNLANEMKLAKQFSQAQNVYGAESYLRGFSGYVCEILAVYYGSFLSLMKNAAKWGDKPVIDAERHYKGKDVFKIVNTSKLISPLIVIDPVQNDRNAAAALSTEKFEAFKKAARDFLKSPSGDFFTAKNMAQDFLSQKTGKMRLIEIKIKPLGGKADIAGSKLLKIYEFMKAEFKKHGFIPIKQDWEWGNKLEASFYFLFDNKPLPEEIEVGGPPAKLKQHSDNFKKMHKKTFVRNNKLFAIEKRTFTNPEGLIKNSLKNKFVRERSSSSKINVL